MDKTSTSDVAFDETLHLNNPEQYVQTLVSTAASADLGAGVFESIDDQEAMTKTVGLRTTVLPHIEMDGDKPQVVNKQRQRYERQGLLGKGGAGSVFLARDNDINRDVAMKILNEEDNLSLLLRFAEEIRTTGKLDHPNIIPIHDVGVNASGQHYFIMKQAQGETLEQIIQRLNGGDEAYHERFSFEVRVQIFMELLRGVQFAHQRGIIHRDLKPANVMIGPLNEVMIMDWGIARDTQSAPTVQATKEQIFNSLSAIAPSRPDASNSSLRLIQTQHGAILGTPAYLSPEQAQGIVDDMGPRSDIYSLSALFYEFLTLRHYLPKQASVTGMLVAVINTKPEIPVFLKHPHQPPVPAALSHFVLRGLEKKPEDRFSSVDAMICELRAIQEGRGDVRCVNTFAKNILNRLNRWTDSHPRAVGAIVLLTPPVTLLGLGLALYLALS